MTAISPSIIPTVSAGSLFSQFTTNDSFNVRWLSPTEPVFFEVFNRPTADAVVRQLVIAKAVDNLQVRLGHQNLFPFINQAEIDLGSSREDIPISLIWDLHVSLPKKWDWIRLAKIKRISGSNPTGSDPTGDDYTGKLRLIFTGQEEGSTVETAIFMADYQIDSNLTFQKMRVEAVPATEESVAIGSSESETVSGEIIFKTLDADDDVIQQFYDTVAPPVPATTGSDGLFESPAEYELADNDAGTESVENDFSSAVFTHGSGMLTSSAINNIPALDSDLDTWLSTFNYPYRSDANRTSSAPIAVTLPKGMFDEFLLIAPDGDRPSDDSTGNYFPVWISKITREDAQADVITLHFSTFNVSDVPSTDPIEFAQLVLNRTDTAGKVVAIEPTNDLFPLATGSLSEQFEQGFGRGHVVLSSKWGITGGEVESFFDALIPPVGDEVEFTFPMGSLTISSRGLSRVPKTIPTVGESAALAGTTSTLANPTYPGSDNKYITENDQGLGDQIDFADPDSGLAEELRNNPAIEQYGYTGALAHRTVKLVIDSSDEDNLDYDRDILPRLVILLKRQPEFGDFWYDGTKLKFFNGDSWQTP